MRPRWGAKSSNADKNKDETNNTVKKEDNTVRYPSNVHLAKKTDDDK